MSDRFDRIEVARDSGGVTVHAWAESDEDALDDVSMPLTPEAAVLLRDELRGLLSKTRRTIPAETEEPDEVCSTCERALVWSIDDESGRPVRVCPEHGIRLDG